MNSPNPPSSAQSPDPNKPPQPNQSPNPTNSAGPTVSLTAFLHGFLDHSHGRGANATVACTETDLAEVIQMLMVEALKQGIDEGALRGFRDGLRGCRGDLGAAAYERLTSIAPASLAELAPGHTRSNLSRLVVTIRRNLGMPPENVQMRRRGHVKGWRTKAKAEAKVQVEGQAAP